MRQMHCMLMNSFIPRAPLVAMQRERLLIACGVWRSAMGALSQSGLMLDERALRSVAPALDQLYSVFNEVRCTVQSLHEDSDPRLAGLCGRAALNHPTLLC